MRRNLFFERKPRLFSLETGSLLKSRDLSKVDYSTIRFLPPRLTRVLLYYLTFIVPVREYLRLTYLRLGPLDSRLFINGRGTLFPLSTLPRLLEAYTRRYLDVELGLRVYRHLAIYVIKDRVLRTRPELRSPTRTAKEGKVTAGASNIEDIISGHSTKTTELNYARDPAFFLNKTRETVDRSLEFAEVYFRYYGLLPLPSIPSLLLTYTKLTRADEVGEARAIEAAAELR